MRTPFLPLLAVLALPAPLFAQDSATHQTATAHGTHALKWGPAPAALPAGAQMAVVRGDPGQAAPFTVRLAVPDGYKVAPHFHPTDETLSVRQGTFLVGMGDTLDLAKTKPMTPGAKATMKAGMHHYAAAKGKTVLQVSGMGPFAITYVNPQDDPRGAQHP